MAWLLHPDDLGDLLSRFTPGNESTTIGQLPPCGVAVSRCYVLERGHIQDTDHPELGAPTFAEYGEAHEKIMEAERVRFSETLAAIEKHMRPMPRLTGYGMAYPSVPRFVIDPKAI